MKIRFYSPSDFDVVTLLWRRAREIAFPEFQRTKGHSFEEDRAYFQNIILQETDVWIVEIDLTIVGFIAIREEFIEQFFVSPDYQRQGVGRFLLAHAQSLSPKYLWLYTFQFNTNGRAFYEKNGFVATKFGVSPEPELEPNMLFEWKREE